MKDSIIAFFCKPDVWKSAIYSISAGGVVLSYFTDPRLQAIILAIGLVLGKPISIGIAKIIKNLTSNYADTPTKIDDIAYAVAEGVIDASEKK